MNIHDVYRIFQLYFRPKRLQAFYKLFNISDSTKLLDIGGTVFFWELAKQQGMAVPKITILNIYPNQGSLPENITWIVADGQELPFEDLAFDIAFSNSVIEHLGNWESQIKFANEIRRIAPNYYVQVPSKSFPIEPHFITPFIHWLPKNIQKRLLQNFTIWGIITRPSLEYCIKYVDELRYLTKKEFSQLFPESKLQSEKFLGLEKSLIAIKNQVKTN